MVRSKDGVTKKSAKKGEVSKDKVEIQPRQKGLDSAVSNISMILFWIITIGDVVLLFVAFFGKAATLDQHKKDCDVRLRTVKK